MDGCADAQREGEPAMLALEAREQRHDVGRAVGRDAQMAPRKGLRVLQQRHGPLRVLLRWACWGVELSINELALLPACGVK